MKTSIDTPSSAFTTDSILNKKSSSPLLYLASQSPRRAELLQQLGLQFEKLCIDVDEVRNSGEIPEEFVSRLGYDKAMAG